MPLHRIIYCSRGCMTGTRTSIDAEISRILARSRANNAAVDVGGALLFSDDCFAQVLEGPVDAVSRTFERIGRDPRHGEVTVLRTETARERYFPSWSMAYAGAPSGEGRRRVARLAFSTAFAGETSAAGHSVLDLLRQVVAETADA